VRGRGLLKFYVTGTRWSRAVRYSIELQISHFQHPLILNALDALSEIKSEKRNKQKTTQLKVKNISNGFNDLNTKKPKFKARGNLIFKQCFKK